MFYSHTFLARKGPLGTVWCAAHLQHRLKKSHYTSTDIPSTVECIMFPDVPIALRMSGHLLLGVVRIYSKKVDYLFHDCNVVLVGLSKAFDTKKVDLPDNEIQAPVQAITLPETFSLDALNLDDDLYPQRSPDNHLRNEEDITLPEQIPTGRDPYVAITFDEDMVDVLQPMDEDGNIQNEEPNATAAFQDPRSSSQTEVLHKSMDFRDTALSNPGELRPAMDLPDSHLSNQAESPNIILEGGVPQDFPEIEVRRDAVHDLSNEGIPPGHSDRRKNAAEITGSLEQVLDDNEIPSPNLRSVSSSGGESMPFHEHTGPPTSAAPQESPRASFGHESPQLAIQPSPPAQPRKRRRMQRMFFDNELVLTNEFMRRELEDTSNLIRERRIAHSSPLSIWKSKNSLKKEQVFNGPSSTGMCADLCDIFRKDYISGRPNLVVQEEEADLPNPEIQQSPPPTTEPMDVQFPATATATEASPAHSIGRRAGEMNMQTECLRDDGGSAFDNVLHGFEPSPSKMMSSPGFGRGDSTPVSMNSLGSETVGGLAGMLPGTGVLPTPDIAAASAGTRGSELKTPSAALFDEGLVEENTGLSDILEMAGCAEADDLHFLEADNGTPSPSESQGGHSLSVRSRAVAQYLKKQSPISENSGGDISLDKVLEGKTRKTCARMFYETLVLKSYGLIDVEQEMPYEDITLKSTTMLSKTQL